jgi:hypothetical protein
MKNAMVRLAALALLSAYLALPGCGAQATPATRSAYAIAAGMCVARERIIIDEPCGRLSEDECADRDYAAMAAERERCALELAHIEQADRDGGTTP